MVRKTLGITTVESQFEFENLVDPGITLLKFGKQGIPHERMFTLSGDLRYLKWSSGWVPKLGFVNEIDMERVIRIMKGQNTYQFTRYSNIYGEAAEKSFSIVYFNSDGLEKTLDLIAPSGDIFNLWVNGLNFLVKRLKEQRQNYSLDALYLKSIWERADTDHSGHLTFKEVIHLVSTINVNIEITKLKTLIKKFDFDHNGYFDFSEFVEFMSFLRKRSDLESIWNNVCNGIAFNDPNVPFEIDTEKFTTRDETITLETFIEFWRDMQGEELSIDEAEELIESSNSMASESRIAAIKSKTNKRKSRNVSSAVGQQQSSFDKSANGTAIITYAMFSNVFMNNSKSHLFDQSKIILYQDMNLPLSQYYIASSHNTYLEGDQLTSFSSVNRYINDLLLGCRCVELDCWDGDNGQPMICHGNTLTGKILFKDVVKAISDYAFVTSSYPVILSVENHCSLEQQKLLAKMMIDIFKEKLVYPMSPDNEFLPSPENLKYKILIKGKRIKEVKESTEEDEEEEEEDDQDDINNNSNSLDSGSKKQLDQSSLKKRQQQLAKAKAKAKANSHSSTHPDLSAITYLATGKVKSFLPEKSALIPADMMASYSEGNTNKNVKKPDIVEGWITHNKRHLSRIYPKGTRIDSSNYSPVSPWATGSQMVALNYQTGDYPYHVNFGRFIENGSCGYVLKPDYMIKESVNEPVNNGCRITINVISANHLPKPKGIQKGEIIDPYVQLFLAGPLPSDCLEARTKTVSNNGFNPIWNQTFVFEVRRPDLSYLTFHVYDEDVLGKEFIAFASLPVNCIRKGIRTVYLHNEVGKRDQDFEYASLSLRVAIEAIDNTIVLSPSKQQKEEEEEEVEVYEDLIITRDEEPMVANTITSSQYSVVSMMKTHLDSNNNDNTTFVNQQSEPDQSYQTISSSSSIINREVEENTSIDIVIE